MRTRNPTILLALLVVAAATIGCDQVSKDLASAHLMGSGRQSYLGDSVRLEYVENTGGFLSLGAELPLWSRTALFSVGATIIVTACLVIAFRYSWSPLALLGLCLVFAGGASNLVDRFADGHVVDFLNVGIGAVRTGIFNVADMAILLGVALFMCRQKGLDDPGTPADAIR